MKRLRTTALVVLILAAHSVQAQTKSRPYLPASGSVYTDIVGEFEPSDDWIVQPDEKPANFSNASSAKQISSGATSLENVEIFGKTPPRQQQLPAPQQFQPSQQLTAPQQTSGWQQTDSGQLWANPSAGNDRWYDGPLHLQFGLDYLYFNRGAAADNFFAIDDLGNEYSLGDIEPGNETTVRTRILIADDGGTGIEVLGYEFEQFKGSISLEGPGITPGFFGGIPVEPAEAYVANYESQLKNYEINGWRRQGERLKFGVGLRYLELEEQFDILSAETSSTTTAGTTASTDGFYSDTTNRVLGAQLMARVYRPVIQQLYLEGGVNGGYGFNRISTNSDTANIDSRTEKDTSTGFIGFNGGVIYRAMEGLTLRAGYEGLLFTSIALAPDQSAAISAFEDVREIQTGELYFGGAYVGGTFRF